MFDWFFKWLGKPTQLDRMESTLTRMERQMSEQEQALDAVLAAVQTAQAENTAATDELVALVTQLIADGKIDLGDETTALQGILERVQATNATINAALPAPPA